MSPVIDQCIWSLLILQGSQLYAYNALKLKPTFWHVMKEIWLFWHQIILFKNVVTPFFLFLAKRSISRLSKKLFSVPICPLVAKLLAVKVGSQKKSLRPQRSADIFYKIPMLNSRKGTLGSIPCWMDFEGLQICSLLK